MDLLKVLAEKYNLQYEVRKGARIDSSATGFKMNYYSINRKLQQFGYDPRYTSLHAIIHVFDEVL